MKKINLDKNKKEIIKTIAIIIILVVLIIFALSLLNNKNTTNKNTSKNIESTVENTESEVSTEETSEILDIKEEIVIDSENEIINNILNSKFISENCNSLRVIDLIDINKLESSENSESKYRLDNYKCLASGEDANNNINNTVEDLSVLLSYNSENNKLNYLQLRFSVFKDLGLCMQYISEVSTMLSEVFNCESLNELAISNTSLDVIINEDVCNASQSIAETENSYIINLSIMNNTDKEELTLEEVNKLNIDIPTLPRISNNYLDSKFIDKLNNTVKSDKLDKENFELQSVYRCETDNIEDNIVKYKSTITNTVININNRIIKTNVSDELENDIYTLSVQFENSSKDFLKEKAIEFSKKYFNKNIDKEELKETDNQYEYLSKDLKINIINNSINITTDTEDYLNELENTEDTLIENQEVESSNTLSSSSEQVSE